MNILVIGVITHDTLTIYRGSEVWQQIVSNMANDIVVLKQPQQLDFFAKITAADLGKAYPEPKLSHQYWKPKYDRNFRNR